jgi:hypothetical protein
MDLQFTAVFRKVPEGYSGFVEEFPGANTQGATLEGFLREGGSHTVYVNRSSKKASTVPRHNERSSPIRATIRPEYALLPRGRAIQSMGE